MVVQEKSENGRERSRRLVHRKKLDEKGRFEDNPVTPTRFVVACPRGHVDDIDWYRYVHKGADNCRRQLWLDERGTGGDLADLTVRCECKKSRPLVEAADLPCRPWDLAVASVPGSGGMPVRNADCPGGS